MSLKQRKQVFQINGRRQTSWLFTESDRGFELGNTKEEINPTSGRVEALNPVPPNLQQQPPG